MGFVRYKQSRFTQIPLLPKYVQTLSQAHRQLLESQSSPHPHCPHCSLIPQASSKSAQQSPVYQPTPNGHRELVNCCTFLFEHFILASRIPFERLTYTVIFLKLKE